MLPRISSSRVFSSGDLLGIPNSVRAFFPNIGRLFDEHGNLASWWNNQSVEAFQQHALCMVDQYGHFSVAGMKVRQTFRNCYRGEL